MEINGKPRPGKANAEADFFCSVVDGELLPSASLSTRSLPLTALSGSPAAAAAAAPHPRRSKPRHPPRPKTLSRRLNSVEAFFAGGAEVKGAFSIGLCVQLREAAAAATAAARNGSGGEKKKGIDADLLRAAACEASLLDQPLARALTDRAASFSPFALPRVVLPRGAPPPEFLVLRREDAAHWEREMERACNRPFRSEEVALLDESDVENEDEMTAGESATKAKKKKKKKRTVRGQRACSFVLLLNEDADAADAEEGVEEGEGGGEQGNDSGGRHHELVVRFHHALFDGKAAVAFVGAVLRRYEAKVAAREEAEEIAAAVTAAIAAAAENDDDDDNDRSGDGGASTPDRVLSPPSSALSSSPISPISPLARWPSVPSTLGAFDGKVGGGDSGSLSPEPRPSPSLPAFAPPPPPRSHSSSPSSFASLPPSTSALSLRLGPRAFFTRIVANVMLMHEGLALARKGLGLKLPVSNGKEGSGGGGGGGEAAAPPPSFSEERCAVSTFALSVEETRAFLRSCRLEGTSANSALAAAALASAAAVGEVSERSGGLSLQTHFDLRGHLKAAGPSSSNSSSSSSRPSPPVGLCSFSEIKWFPLAAFDDAGGEGEGEGHGGGVRASSTRKLWEFARRYGKSVRAAGKVPEGAGFLQRLCGPWRMAPPLTFRLQVRG